MDNSYREKSEFNDAIGHLRRMDTLFYAANNSAMKLDSYNWFHSLVTLYRELTNDISKAEEKELEELREELANKINIQSKQHNKAISKELYNKLHDFEKRLRIIYNKAGYQKKVVDDPRFALG